MSILSADFSRLGEEVKKAVEAGTDYIHFDVMDHHFVPNLSFGPLVCESLRKFGIVAPIDVHLMVENPDELIRAFANAGANLITFHPETVRNVEKTLELIGQFGMKTGLAFNPERSVSLQPAVLEKVDLILLMSVNPGFSGQSFISSSVQKIISTKRLLRKAKSKAMLGVDGGIRANNIAEVSQAGVNFFVVGSGLFHTLNYRKEIRTIRQLI
ncbi:ribulose-phosphate 3-epimerase [Coxiella endosymbiont of Amblyomma sculptum]|uniref:ribulose-phosphate 3-epimerase n=1 Tax=Coxiella endosymbiont of Amblyomma sculptum TaxID=2487929 RepID=UPI00132E9D57|nr:ribulose-phosphate 3-epimerase [Coxiella endosymbiont of Amblyomma sculptum]QHG92665.1 ribulose-phosphate 3-epimerase [Coxiella endosymbiont of Amblyomma sculptum]